MFCGILLLQFLLCCLNLALHLNIFLVLAVLRLLQSPHFFLYRCLST